MSKQNSIDVLTPMAACVLFGRSGEAIRRACREGHVHTQLALAFTGKQIRLIDLKSAVNYWGDEAWPGTIASQIEKMKLLGISIVHQGQVYNVCHPFAIAAKGKNIDHMKDL